MRPYLDLLRLVHDFGQVTASRAVLASTGTRPKTRSIFGHQCRYDLAAGFPLVTTKRVPFRLVAAELLWFLSGSTNVRDLHRDGVHIWDEWADAGGELGPVYGKQWRAWDAGDGRTIDQVAELLRGIAAVVADPEHPAARRLILTAWNPADMGKVRGPSGCHTLAQFHVGAGRLSCHLYQRSADLFLGVPWNIASYALLTCLIARVTGLEAGELVHSFGDAHIYENHLPQLAEQLSREPFPLPNLVVDAGVTALDDFRLGHLVLVGYRSHPALKGEVAI